MGNHPPWEVLVVFLIPTLILEIVKAEPVLQENVWLILTHYLDNGS